MGGHVLSRNAANINVGPSWDFPKECGTFHCDENDTSKQRALFSAALPRGAGLPLAFGSSESAWSYPFISRAPTTTGRTSFPALSEILSSLVLNHDRIVLCGDFNIHVDDLSNTLATDFLSITKS